ncbi:MAG: hypothetical protein SWJ54_13510 [Cyanobacteriota bacterium]|nr:hypothetical protein [Cyanobacteriota bacterium]
MLTHRKNQTRILTLFKLLFVSGFLIIGSVQANPLSGNIREETCVQYESEPGGIKDCQSGFDAGYELGLSVGQNYNPQTTPEPPVPDVEKEFGDRATVSYKQGYLSGYRVGFQVGYQN